MTGRNPGYTNYHIFGSLQQSYNFVSGGGYAEKSPPVLQVAPGGNPDANQTYTGGDVNVANGNVSIDVADLSLPGIGLPLSFSRHYDSQSVTNALTYGSDNGLGVGWSFTYGEHLAIQTNGTVVATNGSVTWDDSEGNQYTFNKSGATFITPAPLIGVFSANSSGYSFRDLNGLVRQFDSNGRLLSLQDHDGNFQTISYVSNVSNNGGYRQISQVADGIDPTRYLNFTYDPDSGDISSITDFTGRTWTYSYTTWIDPLSIPHSLLSQVTAQAPYHGAPSSAIPVTRYTYYTDAELGGLVKRVVNADGDTTAYTYYSDRRSFQVISADGGTTTATYNLAQQSSTFTDALGNTNSYYYNSFGDVIDAIHADQSNQSQIWNNSLLQSDTDAFGQTESVGYDVDNDVTQVTDRLGNISTSSFAYFPTASSGPLAELITSTDADHHSTTYRYDTAGNMTSVTDAKGARTTMTYNSRGEVVSKTSPDGNIIGGNSSGYTTTYTYNSAGQPTFISTGLPSTTTYGYDTVGDMTLAVDADGNATTYGYDLLGRKTFIKDAVGNQTTAVYDAMGNVTMSIDPQGHQIVSTYDPAQLLIRSTSANGVFASLVYDAAGNLVSSTDGLGRKTMYVYDTQNRKVQSIDPTGASTLILYDGDGRTIASTDADGHLTAYGYDADSRRTTVTDPVGNTTTSAYDPAGNVVDVIEPITADKLTYAYDADNRQILSTDALGNSTTTSYDADGNVTLVTDPRLNSTNYKYDVLDRRTLSIDALATNNQAETFYDPAGNVISSVDFDGNRTTYTYDADNRLKIVTDALGDVTTKAYDSDSNVTIVTDADHHFTTYGYDALNRQTSITDAMGNTWFTAFDAAGEAILSTDPLGRQQRNGYDADARPIIITDANGAVTQVSYDAAGNPIQTTDALGHISTAVYDADNRKSIVTDAAGDATTYAYDADGNKIRVTDPRHNSSTYAYDADNRETLVTDPIGNKTTTAYDADSNVTQVTDARGDTTAYGYDVLNRRTSVTDPLLDKMQYVYDPQGNLLEAIDPAQTQPVTFGYDALNRKTLSTDALGDKLTITYDPAGNVTLTVDPDGNRTTTSYDPDNRPIQTVDALGNKSESAYDAAGEMTLTTDPLGRRTTIGYDNDRRPITATDNLGNTTQKAYDLDGDVTLVTDPSGDASTTAYDILNRKTLETDPLGYKTTYSYDEDSNLISLTDPDANTTTYAYDADNRQTMVTDALGLPRLYAYDSVGNLTQQTDRDGRITTFAFDADNRQILETWVGGNYAITTTFNSDSQVTMSSDPDSSYSYTYDAAGRVRTQTNSGTPGSPTVQLSYGYDAASNTTGVTDTVNGAASGVTSYGYDALNREVIVCQAGTGVADKSVTFSYDADSELISEDRFASSNATGTPVVSTYGYDGDGRLTALTDTDNASIIAGYAWLYDADSRIVQQTNIDASSVFTYDADSEILTATSTNPTLQPDQDYTYDSAGNRTNGGTVTGPDNRVSADGTYSYQYDGEGNLTLRTTIATGAVTLYKWDYRDRLTEVIDKTSSGMSTLDSKYTYDTYDRRIGKSVSGDGGTATVSRFVYNGQIVELQFNGSGTLAHRYLMGPGADNVLADEQGTGTGGGTLVWTLGDNQGTIRDVVNSTGVSINHISYDIHGAITNQTNPAAQSLFGYTGQQTDPETGLNYDRARYYSPQTGRFESQDPIGFASHDDNLYRYTYNSPLDGIDPTGTSWLGHLFHTIGNVFNDVLKSSEDVFKGAVGAVVDAGKAVVDVVEAAVTMVDSAVVAVTSGIEAGVSGQNVVSAFDDSLKNSGRQILNELGDAATNIESVISYAGHTLGVELGVLQDAVGGINWNALLTQGKFEIDPPLLGLTRESLDQRFKSTEYDQLGGIGVQVALAAASGGLYTAVEAGAIGTFSTGLIDNTGLKHSEFGQDGISVVGAIAGAGINGELTDMPLDKVLNSVESAGASAIGTAGISYVDPQIGEIINAESEVGDFGSSLSQLESQPTEVAPSGGSKDSGNSYVDMANSYQVAEDTSVANDGVTDQNFAGNVLKFVPQGAVGDCLIAASLMAFGSAGASTQGISAVLAGSNGLPAEPVAGSVSSNLNLADSAFNELQGQLDSNDGAVIGVHRLGTGLGNDVAYGDLATDHFVTVYDVSQSSDGTRTISFIDPGTSHSEYALGTLAAAPGQYVFQGDRPYKSSTGAAIYQMTTVRLPNN